MRIKDFALERKIFLILHVVNCPIVWHDTFFLRERKINIVRVSISYGRGKNTIFLSPVKIETY